MSSIEGIPDGWELVRVGKPKIGEFFIDGLSCPHQAMDDQHFRGCAIIRKIEKSKQYRPFANPEEAEALIGQVLRLKANHKRKSLLIGITLNRFQIGFSRYSLLEAFYCFEKLDGSPFGVEVTS